MPLASKQTCPSCLRTFAHPRGLRSHLRQTRNLEYKELLRRLEDDLPDFEDDPVYPEDKDKDSGEDEIEGVPEVFGGDFFGDDYNSEDFPGWDGMDDEDELIAVETEDEDEDR